jgi:glycosyltransferase involved in cell wall biosynthesis
MRSHSKPRNNILLVIDGFGQGGIQQAYKVLIDEYCKIFDKVYLIVIQSSPSELQVPDISNLRTVRLQSWGLLDFRTLIKYYKVVKKSDPTIIIASIYRSQVWSALIKSKNMKLVWVEHNIYLSRTFLQWKLMKILAKRVYKIIGVSDDVSEYTKGKLKTEIITIPNPLTLAPSKHPVIARSADFVFVSRMTTQKNPELMLRSFARFIDEYKTNSKLHIVGDGYLTKLLKQLSIELGVEKNCIFHGWLDIKSVHELMAKNMTLVSTSIFEGMSIVRLEAFANGCCVVTTETGGTHLFKDLSADGLFIASATDESISLAMFDSIKPKYWTEAAILKRMSLISKFEPNKIALEIID